MEAVTEGSKENDEFFKYTPGGTLTFYCVNPAAAEQIEEGKEYFIDIRNPQKDLTSVSEIDTSIPEGKCLFMAIARLTSTVDTSATPDDELAHLVNTAKDIM
jgi:hypothetical protein